MACRQCTRSSPARVAISRIEKAWLREARLNPAGRTAEQKVNTPENYLRLLRGKQPEVRGALLAAFAKGSRAAKTISLPC